MRCRHVCIGSAGAADVRCAASSCSALVMMVLPTVTVLRSLQELEELMQWVAEFGMSGGPFDRLRKHLRSPLCNAALMEQQPSGKSRGHFCVFAR